MAQTAQRTMRQQSTAAEPKSPHAPLLLGLLQRDRGMLGAEPTEQREFTFLRSATERPHLETPLLLKPNR